MRSMSLYATVVMTFMVLASIAFNNCSGELKPASGSSKVLGDPPAAQMVSSDLFVFGATPAGIMAAVQAKRLGKSVVLTEPTRWLGGMVAGGLSSTDSGSYGVISGLTLEYFKRTNALELAAGSAPRNMYVVQPHIARHVFNVMLAQEGIEVQTAVHVSAVIKNGTSIQSVLMDNGIIYKSKQFIDASYEGDLMAKAGITYVWGRESTSSYGEPDAGVRLPVAPLSGLFIDPYVVPGQPASGLLPYVSSDPLPAVGSADSNIMAYNYRMCATDFANHANNAIPYSQLKPGNYDRTKFIGLQRIVDSLTRSSSYDPESVANFFFFPATNKTTGALIPYAAGKFDINGLGMYTSDVVRIVNSYPDGDEATREIVRRTIADYNKGFIYYLATDPNIPPDVRAYINKFGACKDEFIDNENFPYQLYIREGRRMIGEYVMTEANVLLQATVPDVIAMGGYGMDSHIRQYVVVKGQLMHEGMADRTPFTRAGVQPGTPYPISYRSLTPKRAEVTNLLNPVTLSASSMAYRSLRMEPQYMMMGSAAGTAASLAIDLNKTVQDVPYSTLRAELLKQKQIMVLPNDCLLVDLYVRNGTSAKAFLHQTAKPPQACKYETRSCKNGILSGTYKYTNCSLTSS